MTVTTDNNQATDITTIGARVEIANEGHEYHGEVGAVVEHKSGWLTIALDNTEEEVEVKLRKADLALWVEPVEEVATKTMSGTLNKYRANYVTTHTKRGNKSQSSEKSIAAKYFEGYDHGEVAHMAASLLGMVEFDGLYMQYKHLNNGQMRMNSGNKVNNAIKRGDLVEQDVADLMEKIRSGKYELPSTHALDSVHRPEHLPKVTGQ